MKRLRKVVPLLKKKDVEGKGYGKKRLATTLLSPFTDPLRKKRTITVSDAEATPPCFDPTKPVPIDDVKQFLELVKPSAKKRGYAQPWTKVWKVYFPYNLQRCHWVGLEIDFVRHTATVYDSFIAFTSNSKLVKYLEPISDTLARVLYNMRFYDASEVEKVKQKGMKMSKFMPFTICSNADVPQQCDGTSCRIMTVKFIEHLSAGICLDKVDPSKMTYY
ncbi:PREDICTED: ubiquitin-like-specific protease [Prunus dulcis]|uniref:PREDICTED: ubiquitin-like-specific protease n=1 Tax=Prunus dulcis TaxID=3755 RepID=A0A5E4GBV6_PRUDU|nr:hypothetical protein L3X38_003962 [Prunus dulcis]VVA37375.1 PREDICTED: ubiquitin-like-specific protease [Prunus dulcis]